MILHFHSTITPNSGELKRMKNIDRDISSVFNDKTIEIVIYDSKIAQTVNREKLSGNVVKKYYVPLRDNRLIRCVTIIFIYLYMSLRYRPSFAVFEMFIRLPKYIHFIKMITPKCKLIYDIHGATAEEWAYQGRSVESVMIKKQKEKEMVRAVDYIICQSDEMKRYIVENYQRPADQICVYRCGVDTTIFRINDNTRLAIRRELGIEDNEYLFVYSGGMHPWQRVGDTLVLFEQIHKKITNSKLLILTANPEQFYQIVKEKEIYSKDNHIIVKSLGFQEVPAYLNACDYGFLLRHNHTMNAVASPTKLAEYLACGLLVITSCVANNWVDKKGRNYLIFDDAIDEHNLITLRKEVDRNEVYCYANSYLSLQVDFENLRSFFNHKL